MRVVFAHGLDVAIARDRDPVVRAFDLRLQTAEVLIGLQLRIGFGDGKQTLQGLGQLALGRLIFLERLRIVEQLRCDLDGADFGTRLRHAYEDLLLLDCETLDRGNEVRNQLRAPLVLIDDFRPGGFDVFVLPLQLVVAATAQGEGGQDAQQRRPDRGGPQSEPRGAHRFSPSRHSLGLNCHTAAGQAVRDHTPPGPAQDPPGAGR